MKKKTNPGTDTRIGIIAEQMGNRMVAPLPCNMPAVEIKGIQGTAANGYVAYDKTHELVFTLDSKATITLNMAANKKDKIKINFILFCIFFPMKINFENVK